jgi:hypothetical protein
MSCIRNVYKLRGQVIVFRWLKEGGKVERRIRCRTLFLLWVGKAMLACRRKVLIMGEVGKMKLGRMTLCSLREKAKSQLTKLNSSTCQNGGFPT